MINIKPVNKVSSILLALFFIFLFSDKIMAQNSKQMVRIAKIKIDSAQIKEYNSALNKQMKAAVTKEKGVLTYYAVAEKADSSKITILEIYASKKAYEAHIKTKHFLEYKETVKNMVKDLELIDVNLIGHAINLRQ